ncbi:MAG TPA: DUF6265 family protein [Bryobacteraceae bacterium]|jgi:hypothetical protein|nr:DUF6265 family protein [Bryobacteraceae bacterium]
MWLRPVIFIALLAIGAGPAELQDLSFMAGHWRGEAGGKQIQEIWSAPESGSITGMYREMEGGKTTFYEFLTIEDGKSGPVLLIDHFDPGMRGWEDKNKPSTFHIKDFLPPGEVVFESNDPANPLLLTYSRTSKNTMDVLLERKRDGKWIKQTYKYTREKM